MIRKRTVLYTSLLVITLLAIALGLLFYVFTTGKVIAEYAPASGSAVQKKILFIAGRNSHAPGEHEHRAGVELLDAALRSKHPAIATTIVYGGWPQDSRVFEGIDALVMYCDGGPFHPINRAVDTFTDLARRGVGVVALHYCVEVRKGSAAAAAMLEAIGGYFETDWSVNPHWTANYTALPRHPVTEGIAPFSLLDEWYFNMRFTADRQRVTALLRAVPPPESMARDDGPHSGNPEVRQQVAAGLAQTTAWAYERPNGGRGFGFTGGHFHANWQNAEFRNLVVNAIHWTADAEPASKQH